MLLLLDLGNTSLNVAVYQERQPVCFFKTYSDKLKSENEYQDLISQFLFYKHIEPLNIEGAILSSVVPSLNKRLLKAVSSIINKPCLLISREIKTGLALKLDNPSELGADLICGSIGAVNTYKEDCIIIDLGTASKIFLVTKNKEYLGGAIAPGLRLAEETLWTKTAQLPEIDPVMPKTFIGKNTKDCMSIGILLGQASLVKGLVDKMEEEYQKPVKKILTGGDGEMILPYLDKSYIYDKNLVMDGLYDIYIHNSRKGK